MSNSELKSVAVGVIAGNHWPAHLGLTTDAERIEWLARQVERLSIVSDYQDDVQDCEDCDLCSTHQ